MLATIRYIVQVILCFLSFTVALGDDAIVPDYNKHVVPLFNKYCVTCHAADAPEGEFVLDSYEALVKGGKRGAAISAGNPDQSRLIRMLTGAAKPIMPPDDGESLRPKPEEIELLKQWVAGGEKGPTGKAPDPTVLVTPSIKPTAEVRRAITSVAYSPGGDLIAVGRYRTVELLSSSTRTVRHSIPQLGAVNDLVFTADGTRLIAASGETGLVGEVTIYNIAERKPLHTLRGHKDIIYSLAVSPNGKLLATGSYDQAIKLWDLESGSELKTLSGHNGAIFGLAFHKEGKILASASGDRTVKLWDVGRGVRLDTFSQPTLDQYTVAFSPDGRFVAAGGVDNRIRVWKLSDSVAEGTNEIIVSRFAHEQPIVKLSYSRDGQTIVTSAEDRKVKLWKADTIAERQLLEPQPDVAAAAAFSPDSKTLAVGRLDGTLVVYKTADGAVVAPEPPAKPELAALLPRGAQRGKQSHLKVTGKHLGQDVKVAFSHERLKGQLWGSYTSEQATLVVDTPADLPRGQYDVWLENSAGASDKLKLYVDDVEQAFEQRAHDKDLSPQRILLPVAVWGTLSRPGIVDRYAFDGKSGQTIVLELASRSIGGKGNAVLALYDANGQLLASNNDFDGQTDPLVAYKLPADGRYIVQVNDLMMLGGKEYDYRLTIGELPYVVAVYPLSLPAQRESQVELIGYNLPPDSKVTVKSGASGEVAVPIDAEKFRGRSDLKVLAASTPEVRETEPNDKLDAATQIAVPGGAHGRIEARSADQSADVDHYRFEAQKGQQWIIETTARRRGSPVDTRIDVLAADGQPIERLILQAVRDSYINFRTISSQQTGVRLKNWEEMELNEYVYFAGEVTRLFRAPQGPDSDSLLYESTPGVRRTYFDTSATAHANLDPAYIVEPYEPGTKLAFNGLPVFPLYYSNDDAADRDIATDSRVMFTAPADGSYLVRVVDTAVVGGERYVYRLSIREPKPDFNVRIEGGKLNVPAGSGQSFTLVRQRIDGFDGDIRVDIGGSLPPGFRVTTPIVIEAGHRTATGAVFAAADAQKPADDEAPSQTKLTATATINGKSVTKEIGSLDKIALRDKPKVAVEFFPEAQPPGRAPPHPSNSAGLPQITMAPGTTITARLKITRNEHKGPVTLEVLNLPHGVIVDNLGLNGLLITPNETERQIFITAARWVGDTDRVIHAVARVAENATSAPVMFHIRRPGAVATN